MFPEKIELEIVTPDRLLFSGPVDEVTVPGAEGYMGILPGHAPLLSELKTGVVSYKQGEQEVLLYCGWGFVEVLPDRVTLLSEEVTEPSDIDVSAMRAERDEARKRLESKDPQSDYKKALADLQRAEAHLEAAGAS